MEMQSPRTALAKFGGPVFGSPYHGAAFPEPNRAHFLEVQLPVLVTVIPVNIAASIDVLIQLLVHAGFISCPG